ncbi:DUF1989 domain-containing protein [Blastococcus sp. SYSU D00669]
MSASAPPGLPDLPPGAQVLEDVVVPARGYLRARTVAAGDVVRITDVEGQQVADVVLTRAAEPRDWLSCLNTKLLNGTERITTGHVLRSKQCVPLATIVADTVGVHWFGGGYCSEETNRARYGVEGTVSCKTNLAASLDPHLTSVQDLELDSCASFFMNLGSDAEGRFAIDLPPTAAGDHLDLRAETDLVLALSACPADRNPCNAFAPTPVRVTVYRLAPAPRAARVSAR